MRRSRVSFGNLAWKDRHRPSIGQLRDGSTGAMQVNRLSHGQLWSHRQPWCLLLLFAGLSANPAAHADAVSAVQSLREGGCGGILPPARPLHHSALLDRAAGLWAGAGSSPAAAVKRSGYDYLDRAGFCVCGAFQLAGARAGDAGAGAGQRGAGPRNSLRRAVVCAGAAGKAFRDIGGSRIRTCGRHGPAQLF